jgi:hypothetical protein
MHLHKGNCIYAACQQPTTSAMKKKKNQLHTRAKKNCNFGGTLGCTHILVIFISFELILFFVSRVHVLPVTHPTPRETNRFLFFFLCFVKLGGLSKDACRISSCGKRKKP